jgi:hypothetical protein
MMSHANAAEALLLQLQRLAALRETSPRDNAGRLTLARWQSARLRRTYADLAATPRYAAAAEFFFEDLYGPHDFTQRDADIERVYAMMVRMLPARAIGAVADAMELNALTQELDGRLTAILQREGPFAADMSESRYARAYGACDNRPGRERQIALILRVGTELDGLVRMPLVHGALKLLRRPARAAGLAELQDFLERGFTAFRGMSGADEFLETVGGRERAIMERLFAADPAPFEA